MHNHVHPGLPLQRHIRSRCRQMPRQVVDRFDRLFPDLPLGRLVRRRRRIGSDWLTLLTISSDPFTAVLSPTEARIKQRRLPVASKRFPILASLLP